MKFIGEPIFIVCHARSGSTLLRYLLDTHDQIVCPPELHLQFLLNQLGRVYRILYSGRQTTHEQAVDEIVVAEVRKTIDEMIFNACDKPTKIRWCDKSVCTVDYLELTTDFYPNAQFVCLYRQCMDFVHSAMEAVTHRWGYGYESFVYGRRNHDIVDSLALFWCEKTEAIIEFETSGRGRCVAVKYEELVNNPEKVSKKLFDFLEVSFDEAIVQQIFKLHHQVGPGDPKILRATDIHADSVGLGRNVSTSRLAPTTMSRVNALLTRLGYAEIKLQAGE